MLEQLHRMPEERRKTEIFLHLGIIAFALYNFAELVVLMGPAPVVAGTATGVLGFLYSLWLRARWKADFPGSGGREHAGGSPPYRIRAI